MSNERARMKAAMLGDDRDDAPKHTPEPWFCDGADVEGRERAAVRADDGALLAVAWPGERDGLGVLGSAEQDANAARIVACVNALEGLNPEAVAGVVEFLERLAYADGRGPVDESWDNPGDSLAARAALAALRGKP